MSTLYFHDHINIHPGKLDEFKATAAECMAITKEKDTGTLQYDFFLNADETECVILETYASSEAVLDHVDNLGDVLDRLLGLGELSEEVFGDPSPQLREILAPLNSKIYTRLQGLYRLR